MFSIFKSNIINLLLFLSMVALNKTSISDPIKDSSTNNHNNKKYLNDNSLNVGVKTDMDYENYIKTKPIYMHLYNNNILEETDDVPVRTSYNSANLAWDTEENILENSLFRIKKENEKNKCLLDSLKSTLLWWSYRNGTLKETNHHILKHQEQLDLSHQNINSDKNVLKRISRNVHNLTIVAFSLAHNNLTKVPFLTLKMMANTLKYLTLMGNSFSEVKSYSTNHTAEHCILNETDLKSLKNPNAKILFTGNRKELAWATFPHMPALIELDISHCNLDYINKHAFRNLTNLKNLYMSHNKILNIPADTFFYTPNLQVLDLSFTNVYDSLVNHIRESPNFESILKLFYGVYIEQNFFKYLPKLVYLDLSHTKLRSSSAVAFSYTGPTLKYLSLCFTTFPIFGNGILKNSSLIGLDLSGNANAAFSLNEEVFASLAQSLQFLFFEKANLKDLAWLKPLKNLRFLAISGNNVNILRETDFMPLQQLEILDLSSNQVGNWYSSAFQHNKNLSILGLRDNNINILTSEMLKDFSSLNYLSLGNNNFICDCILHDLVDVSSINNQQAQCKRYVSQLLKDNIHIGSSYLPKIWQNSTLALNTSLINLDINALLVKQNLYKFKPPFQLITQSKTPRINFIMKDLRSHNTNSSSSCQQLHNSYEYSGRKINNSIYKLQLLDYKEEQYWCYNETRKQNLRGLNCQRSLLIDNIEQELSALTTYVLASVGSLLLIALIGILTYMKRWHIYYYYSSLKTAALLSVVSKDKQNNFNNLCNQNAHKIYDIFISYCQSDRDWIIEELLPNVENSGDISICLHERDFQVGVTILDNIVSCMERSKAMMLIISSNFLLSHWCQFEMQLAHHHVLDLSKDNLILVILEDIPRNKRPKNLQFLMNVKTYIKWPGGKCKNKIHPEDRKIFWKRLRRCLKNIGLNPFESKA